MSNFKNPGLDLKKTIIITSSASALPISAGYLYDVILLKTYNIVNIDYLACNTLQYENWNKYYDIIEKETRTIVSASNDATGNLKYGGDWLLENTNTDVEKIYFTEAIKNYQFTLATLPLSASGTTNSIYLQMNGTDIQYSIVVNPATPYQLYH